MTLKPIMLLTFLVFAVLVLQGPAQVFDAAGNLAIQAGGNDDAPGSGAIDSLPAIRVYGEQAGELLRFADPRIVDAVTRRDAPAEDAQENDPATFVHRDLEGQGREGGAIARRALVHD